MSWLGNPQETVENRGLHWDKTVTSCIGAQLKLCDKKKAPTCGANLSEREEGERETAALWMS